MRLLLQPMGGMGPHQTLVRMGDDHLQQHRSRMQELQLLEREEGPRGVGSCQEQADQACCLRRQGRSKVQPRIEFGTRKAEGNSSPHLAVAPTHTPATHLRVGPNTESAARGRGFSPSIPQHTKTAELIRTDLVSRAPSWSTREPKTDGRPRKLMRRCEGMRGFRHTPAGVGSRPEKMGPMANRPNRRCLGSR